MSTELIVRNKGLCRYPDIYRAMTDLTDRRHQDTADEIWCLQHPPVYTLGLRGGHGHVINAGDIPVVKTDRGGQVTYHGPGQLVVYLLIDLTRKNIGVRAFVRSLEQATIDMLASYGIEAQQCPGAPGVYVDHKKIMALGIRIKRGCSYHGIAINVDMNIAAYDGIHACGDPQLEVTQLRDLLPQVDIDQVREAFLHCLYHHMDYRSAGITLINDSLSRQVA